MEQGMKGAREASRSAAKIPLCCEAIKRESKERFGVHRCALASLRAYFNSRYGDISSKLNLYQIVPETCYLRKWLFLENLNAHLIQTK